MEIINANVDHANDAMRYKASIDKKLQLEASIREELTDFKFRWLINSESSKYQFWVALGVLEMRKFNKTYLEELYELLPDKFETKSFKFVKLGASCESTPSLRCKRYYAIFDIEAQ